MGNFSCKIFTKIIATRLGSFIGEILSPSQYGFILNCNIHTCIAITSETINSLCMGSSNSMAIKVDMTKAFDTVSWDFLIQVLHHMGFMSRFIHLVKVVLDSAKLSILLIGHHTVISVSREGFVKVTCYLPFFSASRKKR